MTLHWVDFAMMAALVVAGCGAGYFLSLTYMRRKLAENHREMERRLAALTEALAMHASGLPDASSELDVPAARAADFEPTAAMNAGMPVSPARRAMPGEEETGDEAEIPAEIQVAIAAAAIVAFGNHARVRSARRVPSSDVVSPWTQQGRVIVQSSHNLRVRG